MSDETDELEVTLQDLHLNEIQELLEDAGLEMSDEGVALLTQLVSSAGGLDEALELLSQLQQNKSAA